MKLIVAGSRTIDDYETVGYAIESADISFGPVDEIVHGGAEGVDLLAERWADVRDVPTTVFEPDYDGFENPRSAPIARNAEMATYGDALVAIWNGGSSGTRDMIDRALDDPMPVHVHLVEDQ